jgi:hypothetical protein
MKLDQQIPISRVEPHLNFISSVIYHNHRIRFINNKPYIRPEYETFLDFSEWFAVNVLGIDWILNNSNKEHSLFKWFKSYQDFKKTGGIDSREESDGSISSIPSGLTLLWLAFCYDLLCLFHKNLLKEDIIKRLKNFDQFQGVWYEVVVSATILRAGCNFEWIQDKTQKNCELIAVHQKTRITFGVEAKSRRRPGTFNHSGIQNSNLKECTKQIKEGLTQTPKDYFSKDPLKIPFVLFIDLNVPKSQIS